MPAEGTLLMEGCKLIFRNFSGAEGQYNRKGDRYFHILLEPDLAEQLAAEGWNVHYLRAREEGDEPQAHLQVSVGYKYRPPRIVMVTSKGKTPLGEDVVGLLDWIDIKKVDIIINPYSWNVSGKTGIKAYLKSLYVIVEEDYLELKYNDVPEIGTSENQNVLEGEWRPTPMEIEMLPSRAGKVED